MKSTMPFVFKPVLQSVRLTGTRISTVKTAAADLVRVYQGAVDRPLNKSRVDGQYARYLAQGLEAAPFLAVVAARSAVRGVLHRDPTPQEVISHVKAAAKKIKTIDSFDSATRGVLTRSEIVEARGHALTRVLVDYTPFFGSRRTSSLVTFSEKRTGVADPQ